MISSAISRLSALLLLLGGISLLFASDSILPALIPGFPPAAAWIGQLLAAAWLGLAWMNWLQRTSVLGGIYGRSVVLANAALYLVSALSLIRACLGGGAPRVAWILSAPISALALAYWALLLRGPFDALQPPAH